MTQRTRIKMCGMTRPEDVRLACAAGADAIGMIFYPPSSRYVELDDAVVISQAAAPLVTRVALFVNADAGLVREVVAATGVELLQFHGDESPDYCAQFNTRYIKALRVKDQAEIVRLCQSHAQADAILLDAYVAGQPGGTGQRFDWSLVPEAMSQPLILAGGLNADNVGQAIREVRPFAVDVSGGIEQAPGQKSAARIQAFSAAVHKADLAFNEISS